MNRNNLGGDFITPDEWLNIFGQYPDLDVVTEYILFLKRGGKSDKELLHYTGRKWMDLLLKYNEEQEKYEICASLLNIINLNNDKKDEEKSQVTRQLDFTQT